MQRVRIVAQDREFRCHDVRLDCDANVFDVSVPKPVFENVRVVVNVPVLRSILQLGFDSLAFGCS